MFGCILFFPSFIAADPIEDEDGDFKGKEDREHRLVSEAEKLRVTWNTERRCYLELAAVKGCVWGEMHKYLCDWPWMGHVEWFIRWQKFMKGEWNQGNITNPTNESGISNIQKTVFQLICVCCVLKCSVFQLCQKKEQHVWQKYQAYHEPTFSFSLVRANQHNYVLRSSDLKHKKSTFYARNLIAEANEGDENICIFCTFSGQLASWSVWLSIKSVWIYCSSEWLMGCAPPCFTKTCTMISGTVELPGNCTHELKSSLFEKLKTKQKNNPCSQKVGACM